MSNKRRPVRRAQPVQLRESTTVLTMPDTATTSVASGASLGGYTITIPAPVVATTGTNPAQVAEAVRRTTGRAPQAEPSPMTIREAGAPGGLTAAGGRKYRARLLGGDIWGSSGRYPAEVVRRDGPTAFPIGTHLFLDHPTAVEESERPERSVRDLAGRIASVPVYEDGALQADVEVFPHMVPVIEGLADSIGLSIRADGLAEMGTVDGRSGPIITEISRGHSVDFVTAAGAGGRLVRLLESARAVGLAESGSIGVGVEALIHQQFTDHCDELFANGRLTRPERITLSGAVGDALGAFVARLEADAPQLYVRDRWGDEATTPPDPSQPVGMAESVEPAGTPTDTQPAPTSTPEPPASTQDEPTPDGDTPAGNEPPADIPVPAEATEDAPGDVPDTATEEEEGTMPEEVQAREAADRAAATALREAQEAREIAVRERDEATRETAALREGLARLTAVEASRPIVSGLLVESSLPIAAQTRLMGQLTADVPLTEALLLDESALRARVAERITDEGTYLASVRESAGEGVPSGLGSTRVTESAPMSAPSAEFHTKMVERFKRLGMTSERAEIAARGRAS